MSSSGASDTNRGLTTEVVRGGLLWFGGRAEGKAGDWLKDNFDAVGNEKAIAGEVFDVLGGEDELR